MISLVLPTVYGAAQASGSMGTGSMFMFAPRQSCEPLAFVNSENYFCTFHPPSQSVSRAVDLLPESSLFFLSIFPSQVSRGITVA